MKQSKNHSGTAAAVAVIIAAVAAVVLFTLFSHNSDGEGTAYVRFFDVGQGDAAIFVWDGGCILFDAGTDDSEDKLTAYLHSMGIKSIDAMVLSHPHDDHIGGADAVMAEFDVGVVIMPGTTGNADVEAELYAAIEDEGCMLYEAKAGDVYEYGDVTITVLSPLSVTGNANDDSAVVVLTYGETKFMFTGDAGGGSELSLVDAYTTDILSCDVLKVAHHGSSTSTCDEFLTAVSPDIAVISCGVDNDYGHPHADVIERLRSHSIEILRTDTGGAVTIYTDGKSVYMKSPPRIAAGIMIPLFQSGRQSIQNR